MLFYNVYVIVQTTFQKSDTDKPQKLSGYQLFVKANRKKLAEANPDFTGQELMKVIIILIPKITLFRYYLYF